MASPLIAASGTQLDAAARDLADSFYRVSIGPAAPETQDAVISELAPAAKALTAPPSRRSPSSHGSSCICDDRLEYRHDCERYVAAREDSAPGAQDAVSSELAATVAAPLAPPPRRPPCSVESQLMSRWA